MKRFKFTDLLIGIIFSLLFISISVVATINFRPLYYMDVNVLKIEESSGFGKEEILNNYNALIDYSSPFYQEELSFPTFTASDAGIQHFTEVKNIFTAFYILGAITLILSLFIIIQKAKKKDYNYLLVSSITAIVLPLMVGLFLAIDFDRSFVVFHKLFFKNDLWMFDPVTDPVISILPDTFFMHCAILIILIVLLESSIFLLLYLRERRHFSIKNRKTKSLKF